MTTDAAARERDFFDRLVRDRGEFNPFADRGWRTLARRFERWVVRGRPLDVLDVGCGTGMSRQLYASHARRYVGVDLSAEAIATAADRFPWDDWLVADARALPFTAGSFDVVAFSSVLHHIPEFPAALREARRVLRPGGRAFAFDPNLLHPAMALFRHPSSPLYSPEGVSPNERPLLPRVLREAFAAAGFVRLRQRGQSDIPYRQVAPRLLNAALAAYNAADWAWERVGLGRWFGTFVVTSGRTAA
jgi:SAM-dependent methyltransferase